MKNTKKIIAGIMAVGMVSALTACGNNGADNSDSDATTTTTSATTTTGVTVAVNTAELQDDEETALEDTMSQLPDVELENKTIKWLGNYDLNPSTTGESKSVALEMFERKYGGVIEYTPVVWETRYDTLSTNIVSGNGIDIFPGNDPDALPNGIINGGMFQPVNDYIDLDDPLWANTRASMELMKFGDYYYEFITNTVTQYMVYYNKSTIDAFGFDDPWELYEAGEWNWDTMKNMLLDFVDNDADQYGLDGWYNEQNLFLSTGVPFVGMDDSGNVVCNINDPLVEKAMTFQYDLFQSGLVLPSEQFGWQPQWSFLGEGKTLFMIEGRWQIQGDPATWSMKLEPEDVGIVPVPGPAGEQAHQFVNFEGYLLCKGAGNPEGVKAWIDCCLLGGQDENAKAISDRKALEDNHWTQEILDKRNAIDAFGNEHPAFEMASGCSKDIMQLVLADAASCLRAPFHGTDWASTKEKYGDTLIMLVDEVNTKLQEELEKMGSAE